MGKNINNYKLEKKQLKLEKKRLKMQGKTQNQTSNEVYVKPINIKINTQQVVTQEDIQKHPWYKNPDWLRAVAAIASLIVALVALVFGLSNF